MKNEPCIRLGMRISPKISEKPADSRNSSPPMATLLTASVRYRLLIDAQVPRCWIPLRVLHGERAGQSGGRTVADLEYETPPLTPTLSPRRRGDKRAVHYSRFLAGG